MGINFRKSICICASALIMISLAAPAVNAKTTSSTNNSAKTNKVIQNEATHKANETKLNNLKKTHTSNVKKFNRIKQHIQNHQRNLQKIATRMKRAKGKSIKRQHNSKNIALLNRLNSDKTRLINAIKYNQRGMLRLAKNVKSEEHQINLIKHPNNYDSKYTKGNTVSVITNNYGRKNKLHYHLVHSNHHVYVFRNDRHFNFNHKHHVRNHRSYHIHSHNGKITGTVIINGKSYPMNNSEYQQAQKQMNGFRSLSNKINNYAQHLNRQLRADFRI